MRFREKDSSFLADDRLCGFAVLPFKYYKHNDELRYAYGLDFNHGFAYEALTIDRRTIDGSG